MSVRFIYLVVTKKSATTRFNAEHREIVETHETMDGGEKTSKYGKCGVRVTICRG